MPTPWQRTPVRSWTVRSWAAWAVSEASAARVASAVSEASEARETSFVPDGGPGIALAVADPAGEPPSAGGSDSIAGGGASATPSETDSAVPGRGASVTLEHTPDGGGAPAAWIRLPGACSGTVYRTEPFLDPGAPD